MEIYILKKGKKNPCCVHQQIIGVSTVYTLLSDKSP